MNSNTNKTVSALTVKPWVSRIARIGLITKGIVYTILGALAFMAAFEIGGQSDDDADRTGVFEMIKQWPAGMALLGLIVLGLVCYSIWRIIQSFTVDRNGNEKKWTKRLRYFFSGLTYFSIAVTGFKIMQQHKSNGDQNQQWAARLMNQPYGQWLLIVAAFTIAGIGFYQIWYGISEKYTKHVQGLNLQSQTSAVLLRAGKTGYIARGLVWLVISYLLLRAAIHVNPQEAGDTGKAFRFIEASSFGSYTLAALGLGLIAYGFFNFIRAAYERFSQ